MLININCTGYRTLSSVDIKAISFKNIYILLFKPISYLKKGKWVEPLFICGIKTENLHEANTYLGCHSVDTVVLFSPSRRG